MSGSCVGLAISQLEEAKIVTRNDSPHYWTENPSCLLSESKVEGLTFGTGHEIYTSSIIPAIKQARHEVVLVTCFWARSATLHAVNDALRHLSRRAIREKTKIRVRICLSSSSLSQKLFHTSSLKGTVYHPDTIQSKFGMAPVEELRGLDLEVKSIFVLPFSVMHPKFVIIDRQRVCLPSCNVSWENWFEGCIELSGSVIEQFVRFWLEFWASDLDRTSLSIPKTTTTVETSLNPDTSAGNGARRTTLSSVPSLFLPSPHHINPKFSLPWQRYNPAPLTPLNIYLLTLFRRAQHNIRIQTPNLTSPPVLSELSMALARGVDVSILTSERLMILEQLVTAGTTTDRCVKKLIRQHRWLIGRHGDLEAGAVSAVVGKLRVSYYSPRKDQESTVAGTEPVQSHLKLTIVDDRVAVFGSGNMDRASWYTSQELGVAFISTELAGKVTAQLDREMEDRTRVVYHD